MKEKIENNIKLLVRANTRLKEALQATEDDIQIL